MDIVLMPRNLHAIHGFIAFKISPCALVKEMDERQQPEECLIKLKEEVEAICKNVYGSITSCYAHQPVNRKIENCGSGLIVLLETVLYYLWQSNGCGHRYRRPLNVFYNRVCYELEELLLSLEKNFSGSD